MLKYTVTTIPNTIDLNGYVVNSKYTYNMYIIVHTIYYVVLIVEFVKRGNLHNTKKNIQKYLNLISYTI